MHTSPLVWQAVFSLVAFATMVTEPSPHNEPGPHTRHRWLTRLLIVSLCCWAMIALREMGFYLEVPASAGASAPFVSWSAWESAEDARLA